eukprot:SAG31_NODE_9110_length_1333_cov_0.852512_2_plen_64_part_01
MQLSCDSTAPLTAVLAALARPCDDSSCAGLDPDEDKDLYWIAEAALCAPLPKGWGEFTDSNGNV